MATSQEYEALARQVQGVASTINGLSRNMLQLQAAVTQVIGGTATGEDRMMASLLTTATGQLRGADTAFQEAINAARSAAREAAEEEARRQRAAQRS